jgi:ribosomal 30S subunit maturation factor RimM
VSAQRFYESADGESTLRARAELGFYLSQARGYRVITVTGQSVGVLERVLYRGHTEYPDELVVRRGRIWRRHRTIPFESVRSVDRRLQLIRLQEPS